MGWEKFVKSVTQGRGEILTIQDGAIENASISLSNIQNSQVENITGTLGRANSNTTIEETGFLKFTANAAHWRDIDFPIVIRTTGTNIPTLQTLQGNITAPQWQVNDYNVCEGQELVHSSLFWHCHLITNGSDTTDRFTKWEIEWTWANPGEVLATNIITTSQDIRIPANTPSKTHILAQIAEVPIAGKIAGHIYARLRRIALQHSTHAPGSYPIRYPGKS